MAIVVAVAAAAAWTTPAVAQTPLRVAAGFDGRFIPGARVPVQVTVEADRLVEGTLRVTYPREGEPTIEMPVEVPGGSVKVFTLVVPTRLDGTAPSRVVLEHDGQTTAARIPRLERLRDEELVALDRSLLAGGPLPGPAPLVAETGTARFAELSEALLAQAPDSLESVTVIGLGPDGLDALGPRAREALLRWVALGGSLYIDAQSGPVPSLPEGWQPGPEGRVRAGAGWIRLTGGAMSDGRWPGLVEPTMRSARVSGSLEMG